MDKNYRGTDGIYDHTPRVVCDSRHIGNDGSRFVEGSEPGSFDGALLLLMFLVTVFLVTIALYASSPAYADSPILVDPRTGKYLGNVNTNSLDPNSISNPLGRYGSPLSPDSVNNPVGQYGSPVSPDSVNNPFGTGRSGGYFDGGYFKK